MSGLCFSCDLARGREEDAVRRKIGAGTWLHARLIWMLRKHGDRRKEGEGAATTLGLTHRLRHMDIHGVPRTDLIHTLEVIFNAHTDAFCRKRCLLVSRWRVHQRRSPLWKWLVSKRVLAALACELAWAGMCISAELQSAPLSLVLA